MRSDIDRMDDNTGLIDGVVPGQPYEKQWWMRYFNIPIHGGTARFKKNRFTGATYLFTRPQEGNRWNEPGYGWGTWKRL